MLALEGKYELANGGRYKGDEGGFEKRHRSSLVHCFLFLLSSKAALLADASALRAVGPCLLARYVVVVGFSFVGH